MSELTKDIIIIVSMLFMIFTSINSLSANALYKAERDMLYTELQKNVYYVSPNAYASLTGVTND